MFFLKSSEQNHSTHLQVIKDLNFNNIKVVESLDQINGVYLLEYNNMLSIADVDNPKVLPIAVNFLKPNFKKRLTGSQVRSELLNKVLGKKHNYKTLLDATAGMGVDCMIFAALGLKVQAYEKSEAIYLLLRDGLDRARNDDRLSEIINRVNLNFGNSLNHKGEVDVLYLDFMFNKADKKAKSKKDMEAFKKITNIPSDEELLEEFKSYIGFKFKRLVFKRPLKAEVLKVGHFSHSVEGKAIRYDIYLPS